MAERKNRPRSRALPATLAGLVVFVAMSACAGAGERTGARGEHASSAAANPRITTFMENGGRLDWSAARNLIVFDRRVGDGYFDIYTITPSSKDETCLTCGKTDLPPKSKGNPAWHPSGDYIVFQAQNTYAGLGRITDYFANPGAGINNDLWVMDWKGGRFRQLTRLRPRIGGVLHPQFSPKGDKLFWSERIDDKGGPWGTWALKLADFEIRPDGVEIRNERTFQPGDQHRMYESHGFSPDGRQLLFSGNLEREQLEWRGDIYLYDFQSGGLKNLTNSEDWDEHAHFSPDGKTIAWMTSKGVRMKRQKDVKTDYWLMDADGGNKRRLTHFNVPGYPEYIQKGVVAADLAWSPDGSRIAGYLITDVRKGGLIVMIEMR